MSIDQPKDFPEEEADESQLPLPEDGPAEGNDVETIDVPLASPAADADVVGPVVDGDATTPSDIAVDRTSASLTDESAAVAASAPANTQSPSRIHQIDWSKMTPAPGYADPITGEVRSRPYGFDETGFELSELIHGRRPIFEPETIPADLGGPPPLPFFAAPPGDGGKSVLPGGRPGQGVSPLVRVDVQVSFTPEGTARVSSHVQRAAAELSRAEICVVGRRLSEFIDESRRLESARRSVWGR
jgi:hypothetical protein